MKKYRGGNFINQLIAGTDQPKSANIIDQRRGKVPIGPPTESQYNTDNMSRGFDVIATALEMHQYGTGERQIIQLKGGPGPWKGNAQAIIDLKPKPNYAHLDSHLINLAKQKSNAR